MKLWRKAKPEAVASKDVSRPLLTNLYLSVTDPGKTGVLKATDSYCAVRIPVELDEKDTAGYVDPSSLTLARKGSKREQVDVLFDEDVVHIPEHGMILDRPKEQGTFPDIDQLFESLPAVEVEFGVNVNLLRKMADAFGTEELRIRVGSPLRPLHVLPISQLTGGPDGIVMPIRLLGT